MEEKLIDILQFGLLLLILVLGIILSVLGLQVFNILTQLKKQLEKLDRFLSEAEEAADEIKQVSQTIVAQHPEVKIEHKQLPQKPVKRLFRRRLGL